KRLGKRSYEGEIAAWVHSTDELPLSSLLQGQGVKVVHDKAPLAQQLGLRVSETGGSLVLKTVLRGGAAEAAGMAAGDEWLGVEFAPTSPGASPEAWRIHRLDELPALRAQRAQLTALVSRDKRLVRCALTWPTTSHAT